MGRHIIQNGERRLNRTGGVATRKEMQNYTKAGAGVCRIRSRRKKHNARGFNRGGGGGLVLPHPPPLRAETIRTSSGEADTERERVSATLTDGERVAEGEGVCDRRPLNDAVADTLRLAVAESDLEGRERLCERLQVREGVSEREPERLPLREGESRRESDGLRVLVPKMD